MGRKKKYIEMFGSFILSRSHSINWYLLLQSIHNRWPTSFHFHRWRTQTKPNPNTTFTLLKPNTNVIF